MAPVQVYVPPLFFDVSLVMLTDNPGRAGGGEGLGKGGLGLGEGLGDGLGGGEGEGLGGEGEGEGEGGGLGEGGLGDGDDTVCQGTSGAYVRRAEYLGAVEGSWVWLCTTTAHGITRCASGNGHRVFLLPQEPTPQAAAASKCCTAWMSEH